MPKKAAKTGNGAALKPGIYRQRLMPTRTVAVCTLHSADLVDKVAAKKPRGLAVVGLMRTENLGIERIIENICANQNIHSLVVCGEDTGGRIGHFPGQTFIALMENGVDAKKKIVGAKGKRPVLKNLPDDVIDYFRKHVHVEDMRGVTDAARIAKAVERLAKTIPPRTVPAPRLATNGVRRWKGEKPKKLVLDPGGYFVVYPDIERRQLYVEHYDNAGTLRNIVEGDNGIDIINIIIREKMVTRMDHSAYVARELALAEQAILRDSIFVQDRAPGDDK